MHKSILDMLSFHFGDFEIWKFSTPKFTVLHLEMRHFGIICDAFPGRVRMFPSLGKLEMVHQACAKWMSLES